MNLAPAGRFRIGARMERRLTISALAQAAAVRAKTLRCWKSLGLLPRAEHSHTGYRLFELATARYVEFVGKGERPGLTLGEIGEVPGSRARARAPARQWRSGHGGGSVRWSKKSASSRRCPGG